MAPELRTRRARAKELDRHGSGQKLDGRSRDLPAVYLLRPPTSSTSLDPGSTSDPRTPRPRPYCPALISPPCLSSTPSFSTSPPCLSSTSSSASLPCS
uniref:Uncharacterized protein n=1 Tax=Arundo donax TaxID=35708 RepID=A0A0A9HET8_ARUDO